MTEFGFDGKPPGEHEDDLPDEQEQSEDEREVQQENAETSKDQPSQ
jgi:hypothetical protein